MSKDDLARFAKLPDVLVAFETLHEHVRFDRSGALRGALPDEVGPLLRQMRDAATHLPNTPIASALQAALDQLRVAEETLRTPGPDPSRAFLQHRRDTCDALRRLYPFREALPGLAAYWLLPDARDDIATLEHPNAGAGVAVGLVDLEAGPAHGPATLYVPESYTPTRRWPVVLALHGAYGRGSEYVFSWLRPAKSHRYLVVAPNSYDVTWSILNPPRDGDALLALLDRVASDYAIDPERILLTGLSDGGTFTYLAGLAHADRFAGIAPIAGAFHEMMDPLLRQKSGQNLPTLIVHGAKDPIFPVRSIRSAHELMVHLGYQVTYEELPDWGHAYPYSIHERLVLPWFESLRG